jgi:hypothetical protein
MMILLVGLLVTAIVNEGSDSGDADAKSTEPEVVQNDGG